MKRAAVAFNALASTLARTVGLEGGFLLFGIVLLAYASQAVSPFGPAAVIGSAAVVIGIALTVPRRAD